VTLHGRDLEVELRDDAGVSNWKYRTGQGWRP
jgi:hypothetical protein